MTKQEIILWLRQYIKKESDLRECENVVNVWKSKITEHSKPLKEEKKTGILGSIATGLIVAVVGAIPCAIVFAIIWFVWSMIELFKTNLREHPDATMYSTLIIEKAAGLVIKDVPHYFIQHEILGPVIGMLIIGAGISCILGILATIITLSGDKSVPAKNKKLKEEYEKNQALLPQLQMMYELHLKKKNEAKNELAQMEKTAIFPNKYLCYARELLDFLESGRADTLKEALNLLHQNWDEMDRLSEMQRHHRALEKENAQHNAQLEAELRKNSKAAERAADAAAETAYWEKKRYVDDFFDKLMK